MKRVMFLLAAALALGGMLPAQQGGQPPPAPEFKIPPEAVKRENPVKPTDSSVAQGKSLFRTQCAMCHGATGDGKGDLAVSMELKMKDYRNAAALKDMTDGELFYILEKGKGSMPGEEGRMKPNQMWNMINFIRSLAKKEAAAEEKAEKKAEKPPTEN